MVRPQVRDLGDGMLLYKSTIYLMNEQYKLTRQIYNIFDLLGDLGGVTEVIMVCFGFFLFSISEHSFVMTASQKLFFARTQDGGLFLQNEEPNSKYLNQANFPGDTSKREMDELKKHRYIDVSLADNIMLYFSRIFGVVCSNCCFSKKFKLQKLYEEGEEKLSNELDIVKILKTLRDMKILLKGTLLSDPGTKFHVKHAPKNILNLDETSDISSDGCHHGDEQS